MVDSDLPGGAVPNWYLESENSKSEIVYSLGVLPLSTDFRVTAQIQTLMSPQSYLLVRPAGIHGSGQRVRIPARR